MSVSVPRDRNSFSQLMLIKVNSSLMPHTPYLPMSAECTLQGIRLHTTRLTFAKYK